MDRDIPLQIIRKAQRKTWIYGALALLVVVATVSWMRSALSTTLKRSEIRVAVVETGDVENTLTASGEVQPEFEQVVTSPLAATLQQVFFRAGDPLRSGEKILELDKEFTRIEFEKQKDQLELKRNGIVRIKLDLDKSFYDIQIQDSIKAYRINSLQADLADAKRLFKAGGGTRETIEQAETNLRVAQLEKRQLENDIRSRQAVMRTSIRESEITASIQEKELSEFERKLWQADIVATRSGVLTYVNTNLGAKVNEGDVLARIADLSSFKILGSISDNYLQQLHTGMSAIVRINDSIARGTLLSVHPAVADNVASFDVLLSDKNANSQLRPNLKVDVFLVTAAKTKVLRVQNGPGFKGAAVQDVFVLRPDGKAERRRITTGLVSFDYVEIIEGLQPGETVIISDMNEFKNVNVIDLQ